MTGYTNLEQQHRTYHQDPQPDDIACTFLEEEREKYTKQSSRKETSQKETRDLQTSVSLLHCLQDAGAYCIQYM